MSLQSKPQSQAKGILSILPTSWVPFAELIRLEKPAGYTYMYVPAAVGTLLAAILSPTSPGQLITVNVVFFLATVVVRSLACAWNDILDQDYDRKVARTRLRPLARGAISTEAALFFTAILLSAVAFLESRQSTQFCYYTIPYWIVHVIYPLAKRVTNYPQLILGFAQAWGTVLAFPALGLDLLSSSSISPSAHMMSAGLLYTSMVAWEALCDLVYAAQDLKDDKEAGVKSMALHYQRYLKMVLGAASSFQVACLVCVGLQIEAEAMYFAATCGGTAVTLGVMVQRVNLGNPADCMWWFKYGSVATGLAMISGLVYEYGVRLGVRK
ncbi:Para-hydroxybenzoate--polyprenyltransferase, mitochondrial precursor (PHB:polyprenyltransferase) [Loxospora ochrophaea]|nr:Para-hydroxybenzoate--polyprenyltransferase, mitochondrial precursor (PHB:polyprenyltransferase) [Loxospora ochrophaea]